MLRSNKKGWLDQVLSGTVQPAPHAFRSAFLHRNPWAASWHPDANLVKVQFTGKRLTNC